MTAVAAARAGSSTSAVRTHALVKRYGQVLAVDGVDLDVREGDRYGLLGPNGSGKTTLLRMLLGLVHPTSGSMELLGAPMPKSAHRVLPQVGALVEGPGAYGHLSGRANLELLDAAGPGGQRRTRRARVDAALDEVGLAGVGRRRVKAYSLGMRQRLGLAAALLRAPRLLILDEPTNGLDPQGIHETRELFHRVNRAGTTILLSSHLLAEVEQLCTRVGVVDRGRLAAQGDLDELRASTGCVDVWTPDPAQAVRLLDGRVVERAADRLLVRADDPAALNALLVQAGVPVTSLLPRRRSLEDAVLDLTGPGNDRVG